jgi:hypothetical protein
MHPAFEMGHLPGGKGSSLSLAKQGKDVELARDATPPRQTAHLGLGAIDGNRITNWAADKGPRRGRQLAAIEPAPEVAHSAGYLENFPSISPMSSPAFLFAGRGELQFPRS